MIKTEPTIEKLPNFRQILMILLTYLRQNFNVVAGFALELLGFDFSKKLIFSCSFAGFDINRTIY